MATSDPMTSRFIRAIGFKNKKNASFIGAFLFW